MFINKITVVLVTRDTIEINISIKCCNTEQEIPLLEKYSIGEDVPSVFENPVNFETRTLLRGFIDTAARFKRGLIRQTVPSRDPLP